MTIKDLTSQIAGSNRPVFVWGAGVRGHESDALSLAEKRGIPVAVTWGAIDLIHHDHPLFAGAFGTHGSRAANYAIQNSDMVVSIGSRLDTKATGSPRHFVRGGVLAMVDIDKAELDKFQQLDRKIDIPLHMDAGEFIESLSRVNSHQTSLSNQTSLSTSQYASWIGRIHSWKEMYDERPYSLPGTNPYELMKEIAKWTTPEDVIVSDTGTALGYVMQSFPFKGERFLHAFNMTPMGYGIPAAIGASIATGKRAILITGDGSIMMSLPELATIFRHDLQIRIILLNNGGHAMCRQTERQWLGGKYCSTDIESGLGFPNDWRKVFEGFGITDFEVHDIHPDAQLTPQAKYGQPIEDADPQLQWDEHVSNMFIEPLERV